MTRKFSMVSPDVWRSRKFQNLPSDDARYLFLYILTNDHQTICGVYLLPEGYACSDLCDWPPQKFQKARQQLIDAQLIHFDATTGEIAIEDWYRYNPLASPKHKIGAERAIERIQSSQLRKLAEEALHEAWSQVQKRNERDAKASLAQLSHTRRSSP